MKSRQKKKILSFLIALMLFFVISGYFLFFKTGVFRADVAPPALLLEPASGTYSDTNFNVDMIVDPLDYRIDKVDVSLTYDPAILSVVDADPTVEGVQIQVNPLLGSTSVNSVNAGTITLSSSDTSGNGYYGGRGVLATITFRGLQSADTAVSFNRSACNIMDHDSGLDILANLQNGSYTINLPTSPPTQTATPPTGGTKTSTPTPEPSPTQNPTEEPTSEPTEESVVTPEEAPTSVVYLTPTPTSGSKATPTPWPSVSSAILLSKLDLPIGPDKPSFEGQIALKGFRTFPKYYPVIYFGVPFIITFVIGFFWWRKRKKLQS